MVSPTPDGQPLPPGAKYMFALISVITVFHTAGYGAFIIVLYDFLTIKIANNDLAVATAYWGSYVVLGKVSSRHYIEA